MLNLFFCTCSQVLLWEVRVSEERLKVDRSGRMFLLEPAIFDILLN